MTDEAGHSHSSDWKHDGVRVVPSDQLDGNVPSTPGMDRKAAINFARVGAQKLWAGTVHIHPDAKTGANRAISGALEVNFTQVQLLPPDPAEFADALARRYTGVPYRGTPAPRSASEESDIATGKTAAPNSPVSR